MEEFLNKNPDLKNNTNLLKYLIDKDLSEADINKACEKIKFFNKWTNEKIITSCKKLTETEYKKDRGAFFSSIHGTLNHLLVVDRAFVGYIEEKNHGLKSLDQILYENLFQLEEARIKEDKRLVDLINNLSEESMHKEITYQGFDSGKQTYTINLILMTLFNHQTHHRGQVHNMLSQAGVKPPQIDIPDFVK